MRRTDFTRSNLSISRSGLVDAVLGWPRPVKRFLMVAADLIVVPASLWAAFALKFDSLAQGFELSFVFYLSVASVSTLIFAVNGLYRAVVHYIGMRVLLAVLAGVTASAVVLWILGTNMLMGSIAKSVVAIYWLLALVWVAATRLIARWMLTPFKGDGTRVVIYGAGDAGVQLSIAIGAGRKFVLLAFVDENPELHRNLINGVPVIAPQRLPAFVRLHEVNRILLAIPSASRKRRAEILLWLEQLNVHTQSVPNLSDVLSGRARVDELREIDVADLLGRDQVPPNGELLEACIRDKAVMVSGAGGSIGSELCRQIVLLGPRRLVLFENSEIALYNIERQLRSIIEFRQHEVEIVAILGDAHHKARVREVMQAYGVQTVYHAAAYKHVPIVERNLIEGVHNNVFGTWYAAEAALEVGVETFVLISTDKAVNPTSVMGASKRFSEIILQSLQTKTTRTRFCMVRFGNVLGSSGSVVPLFQEQIRYGGPVTVTHRDVRRYFMTVTEAAQLVLQAGSMGTGGDVLVLDMGEPVRIDELARRMIKLTGLTVRNDSNPEGDIRIEYSGLRPGEKLYEELLIGENIAGTGHPMIMRAIEHCPAWDEVKGLLDEFDEALGRSDCQLVLQLLQRGVKEYTPASEIHDLIWQQLQPAEEPLKTDKSTVTILADHRLHH